MKILALSGHDNLPIDQIPKQRRIDPGHVEDFSKRARNMYGAVEGDMEAVWRDLEHYLWKRLQGDEKIFVYANRSIVTHESEGQKTGIRMGLDRVIGLLAPSKMHHNSSYYPIEEKPILLPFLVIEATKEEDSVEFRAIHRAAFSILRFVKAQSKLHNDEACLVWFLTHCDADLYLHAGTYTGGELVRHVQKICI